MRRFAVLHPQPLPLTPWESKIFSFLRRVAATHPLPSPELRVAGGWVRDKLLRRPAGDIDIAVRHVSGFHFASSVHAHAASLASGAHVPNVSSVAVIAPNPAKSRHLETATVRLDGHDLDFVQLRAELYAEGEEGRVPARVRAATPEEDAMRRDFTVNALFYNLDTSVVEDWTGMGLSDLREGVLRAPVDASVTLREDPLRAMRALRFACRLGFEIDEGLRVALGNEEVREGLVRKVSRERIGGELLQIVEARDVVRGLRMIAEFRLVEAVFFGEKDRESAYMEGVERVRKSLELAHESDGLFERGGNQPLSQRSREVLILAGLLDGTPKVRETLREALKARKRLQVDVHDVLAYCARLTKLAREWYAVSTHGSDTEMEAWVEIAELVRQAGVDLWQPVAILASVKTGNERLVHDLVASGVCSSICRLTYAVDGRRLQSELGIRPGPEVGKALRELMQVQLQCFRKEKLEGGYERSADVPLPDSNVCLEFLKVRRKGDGATLGLNRWVVD